jgi:hypothetical protein
VKKLLHLVQMEALVVLENIVVQEIAIQHPLVLVANILEHAALEVLQFVVIMITHINVTQLLDALQEQEMTNMEQEEA